MTPGEHADAVSASYADGRRDEREAWRRALASVRDQLGSILTMIDVMNGRSPSAKPPVVGPGRQTD